MTRKFKLLILSLLGFSTACSGVKNTSRSQRHDDRDTTRTESPAIKLMYGVRRPEPVVKVDTLHQSPSELDAARSQQTATQVKDAEVIPPVVAMYGVRVPVEGIDLDSLKRVQQQRIEAEGAQVARQQNTDGDDATRQDDIE